MKFQLGGGSLTPPPFGYAYSSIEENKKGIRKFSARFLAFSNNISMIQKIVLSSSRGHGNFRGLEASRPRPRTSKCVLEYSTSAENPILLKYELGKEIIILKASKNIRLLNYKLKIIKVLRALLVSATRS